MVKRILSDSESSLGGLDEGESDGHHLQYSPEILPQNNHSHTHVCTLNSSSVYCQLSFERPLRDSTNVTPPNTSSHSISISNSEPPPRVSSFKRISADVMQTQLVEILAEVKKTNQKVESYDEKFQSLEQMLLSLEQVHTPSSSEGSSGSKVQKRKVPAHVRVCNSILLLVCNLLIVSI